MPQRNNSLFKLHFASLVLVAGHAFAQTPPDAGTLQQQIERGIQPTLPQPVSPDRPAAPPAMAPGGISLTVTQFRFAGNTLLSDAQLAAAVVGFLDRPLDFAQLQAAAMAVATAYREAGWIVRAYLPAQDIQDGIVTIQIVEAVFGKLVPEGEPSRVGLATVLSRFEAQQRPGDPVSATALDRGLLLADDLPGISVAGSLRPGAAEGQTDLVVKVADTPLWFADIGVDNTGNRSTGRDRLTASLAANSPLRLGDQLVANLIHSRGSDYLRFAYSVPVGSDGWRLGLSASHFDYKLISPQFRTLNAKGDSTSFGIDASYPLIRSRLKNLYLNLAYDQRRFDNRANGETTSDYRIDSFSVGLLGNLFDVLGGGGANSASLILTQGRVDLGRLDRGETARLDGSFTKLRYSLTRQQVLTPTVSFFTAYSGQWTSDDLDSSERFYLGGAYGVRTYPTSEAGGARGQLLHLELRWRLPHSVTATAFYDWGRVKQTLKDSAPPSPNAYSLKGYGLSLGWQAPQGVNLSATWARRDGRNPNPTITGKDQDGSLDKNRFWLTARYAF